MKKLIVLALVALLLFCACGKKEEDGAGLLIIPDDASVKLLDTKKYDVLPYERDNSDVERLLKKVGALKREEVTAVEFIDFKDDTPFVCIYVEREENVNIFKVYAMGENKCAAILYQTGAERDVYDVEFESEEIANLTKKIYSDFEEKQ